MAAKKAFQSVADDVLSMQILSWSSNVGKIIARFTLFCFFSQVFVNGDNIVLPVVILL